MSPKNNGKIPVILSFFFDLLSERYDFCGSQKHKESTGQRITMPECALYVVAILNFAVSF